MPKDTRGADGAIEPGQKIKILRDTLRLSQGDVAQSMRVERGTVASYESRPNATPSVDKIRALVEELVRRHGADRSKLLSWFYDGSSAVPDLSPPGAASGPSYPVYASKGEDDVYIHSGVFDRPLVNLEGDLVAVKPIGSVRAGYGATVYVKRDSAVVPGSYAAIVTPDRAILGIANVENALISLWPGPDSGSVGRPNGYAVAIVRPQGTGLFEVEYRDGLALPG